jgi:hypothetical protein
MPDDRPWPVELMRYILEIDTWRDLTGEQDYELPPTRQLKSQRINPGGGKRKRRTNLRTKEQTKSKRRRWWLRWLG